MLWILDIKPDRAVILSDGLSSLTSISTCHSSGHPYLLLEVLSALKAIVNLGIDLWSVWIPVHVGIIGNEIADKLAKSAISHVSPDIIIPLSISDLVQAYPFIIYFYTFGELIGRLLKFHNFMRTLFLKYPPL